MRINVYSEEMTGTVTFVGEKADTGQVFVGLRFVLEGSTELHNTPADDDTPAVTFWFPDTREGRGKLKDLAATAYHVADRAANVLI